MVGIWLLQLALLLLPLTIFAFLLGEYMAKVFAGERTFLSPILMPIETMLYKIFGIDPSEEMDWKTFTMNFLVFVFIGIIGLFILQRIQGVLPFNPQGFKAVRWDTAINTAISFVTNTNWQAYQSEATMSYLTRMLGMGLQNFL